jgi:hypothetical protein
MIASQTERLNTISAPIQALQTRVLAARRACFADD